MKTLISVVILSVMMVGCSNNLTREAATEAVNQRLQQSYMESGLPFGRVGKECDMTKGIPPVDPAEDVTVIAGEKHGFLKVTPDRPGFWRIELAAIEPELIAPEAIERAKHGTHLVAKGCDYQFVLVTLAKRSLVDILAIGRMDNGNWKVAYQWKWVLTPFGAKFVDQLSRHQLERLNAGLNYFDPDGWGEDPTFTLVGMPQSATSQNAVLTLTKTKDGWSPTK